MSILISHVGVAPCLQWHLPAVRLYRHASMAQPFLLSILQLGSPQAQEFDREFCFLPLSHCLLRLKVAFCWPCNAVFREDCDCPCTITEEQYSFSRKGERGKESVTLVIIKSLVLTSCLYQRGCLSTFFFFFFFFRASPVACGGSWARGRIRAGAPGLPHSPTNRGSEPQLMAMPDP